jgi:hypothetical protein
MKQEEELEIIELLFSDLADLVTTLKCFGEISFLEENDFLLSPSEVTTIFH